MYLACETIGTLQKSDQVKFSGEACANLPSCSRRSS